MDLLATVSLMVALFWSVHSFAWVQPDKQSLPPAARQPIRFVRDIKPILISACHSCHDGRQKRGAYRLDLRSSALAEGRIIPGKSAESPLIQRVAGIHAGGTMPPKGPPLTPVQIGLLRAWIDQGADWPEESASPDSPTKNWSLQPLHRPPVPEPKKYAGSVRNPIDAFVLHRLEQAGLTPSLPADRRALLRRVTQDLTGLPPTIAEMNAFLDDPSPDAYETVVDRLLASPRYGERWARHWMDVIHFAESHGHDQDVPRENAWLYRDYLIRSFNEDKPYARFIEEQVAGDILFPNDPQATIALGMISAGPWDESSQQSIRDDTFDKKMAQTLDRDDMVTTVLGTFTSTTVHCARCHDHKFDPITQAEYYGLQAVFAGVDRANRPVDLDPAVAQERKELLALKTQLTGPVDSQIRQMADTRYQALISTWEQQQQKSQTIWQILNPDKIVSKAGSKATKGPDHSFWFADGPRPDTDVYTIEATSSLEGIRAIRLEVLSDDRLPHGGPGRQDNGNLHLTQFHLEAQPANGSAKPQMIPIQAALADFNQEGWDISRALDNNPATAWGIYPSVGKSHQAIFLLKEPLSFKGGVRLIIRLDQFHGGGHLIGRPRLSVTTQNGGIHPSVVPDPILAILAVPAQQRTETQKSELARHVLLQHIETRLPVLSASQMVYAAASDFKPEGSFQPTRGVARPIQILKRGDIRQPLAQAQPGAIACVQGLKTPFQLADSRSEGIRRAALARWLSNPSNVLTWRSIVNRVWHDHFGTGIVATPNDLGQMGSPPTHPELLDWLAVEFRDRHLGSLKKLHRLILTSNTYRQSSRTNPENAKKDGENRLLWRMNWQRLDAEAIHDSVLAISGKLDTTMGGPSVKQFVMGKGIHVTPTADYLNFDVDNPGMYRRSIYRFLFRTLPDPWMDTLDCPDASQFTPKRSSSVTALQALAMLNDRFLIRQAEHLANRLIRERSTLEDQIQLAYQLVLSRPGTIQEVESLGQYCKRHGLTNGCRILLNCNEFIFVP